jgi:hypothetical protein
MRLSRVALVAFGALLALQCALAQTPRGPGATGVPTEMSSSVITFYNSGKQQVDAAAELPHTAREPSIWRLSAIAVLHVSVIQ